MEIHFSDDLYSNLVLIEAPAPVIDFVTNTNNELILKGAENTILCTNAKSYELKYLETSNTFLVLNNSNGATDNTESYQNQNSTDPAKKEKKIVNLMTNHTLECTEYNPKKYQVYNILKQRCGLIYNKETGVDNFSQFEAKYTLSELFTMSELCLNDFYLMLKQFGIFEKYSYACIFNESFLYSVLDDILFMISSFNMNYERLSLAEIFSDTLKSLKTHYNNFLNKLSDVEKHSIISHVFDQITEDFISPSSTVFYKLNVNKAKLLCVKNIFEKKESNFKLDQFVTLLNHTMRICLPKDVIDKIDTDNFYYNQTTGDDNIFEGYKEYDLTFLNGVCIVYFLKTQRDPLIRLVDITEMPENFRERLNFLYKIKEKWTLRELKIFFADLNVNNIEEKIGSCLKLIAEMNPFDSKRKLKLKNQKNEKAISQIRKIITKDYKNEKKKESEDSKITKNEEEYMDELISQIEKPVNKNEEDVYDERTEAEKLFDERNKKRLPDKINKKITVSYKQKSENFKKLLSKLPQHYDIPKVGPG